MLRNARPSAPDGIGGGAPPAYDDLVQRIRSRHLAGEPSHAPAPSPPSASGADHRDAAHRDTIAHAGDTPPLLAPDWQREYDALVRSAQVMKSALFNAGKRLERKHASGQFTFALSGVYGFLVPLFTLQFEPYFPSGLVSHTISFMAATAGAISFAVAMLYQQQDLITRAQRFYRAGRSMNKLHKDLRVMRLSHPDELRRIMHHYDEILADCENHDEIDYEFALLGYRPRDNRDGRLHRWIRERRRLDFRFIFQTYSLLAVVWLLPPAIGLGIWMAFAK